jgi:hypothetical protein
MMGWGVFEGGGVLMLALLHTACVGFQLSLVAISGSALFPAFYLSNISLYLFLRKVMLSVSSDTL